MLPSAGEPFYSAWDTATRMGMGSSCRAGRPGFRPWYLAAGLEDPLLSWGDCFIPPVLSQRPAVGWNCSVLHGRGLQLHPENMDHLGKISRSV